MASLRFHSSNPDPWIKPRPYSDPSMRYMRFGPIQSAEKPGFFARLLGFG